MSDLFYPMEADGADYPQPAVPILVPPSWSEWLGKREPPASSAFLHAGESFVSGRYALAEAMRRAGAGPGRAVLLPSFHCRAIVEPAVYLGAKPIFYPVSEGLRPEFSVLPDIVRESKAAAMVLTHYFGFPNALAEARRFCKSNDIALIEDCAHALYGLDGAQSLGTVGDFAVASLWKFLAVRDGAVLLDNANGRAATDAEAPPILAELKGLAALIELSARRAFLRSALPSLDVSFVTAEARRISESRVLGEAEQGLKEFETALAATAALRCSRRLAVWANHGRVARRRRDHYIKWSRAIQGTPGVRALFPSLPKDVVPYAFPLLVDNPEAVFHGLKVAGVPFWRWEDMARSDCNIAQDYRPRLLQLPCHQGLSEAELEWMIQAVLALASA